MRKVMVVDDNVLVRYAVRFYLTKRGYNVTLCDSPSDAMDNLMAHNPDIILIDLHIAGPDVRKLAELANKARAEIGCKLVVFSSEDESVQTDLVRQGHADGYFKKMYSLDGLDDKLRGLYTVTDGPNNS
jgi:CheY-like chemotaxis protein